MYIGRYIYLRVSYITTWAVRLAWQRVMHLLPHIQPCKILPAGFNTIHKCRGTEQRGSPQAGAICHTPCSAAPGKPCCARRPHQPSPARRAGHGRGPGLCGPCDYRLAVPLQQPSHNAEERWFPRSESDVQNTQLLFLFFGCFCLFFFFLNEISNETAKDKGMPGSSETMTSPRGTSGSSPACPSCGGQAAGRLPLSASSLNNTSRQESEYSLQV